jgi:phosphoglycerate kinase
MNLVSIDEIDIKEKRVFIRVDFNVPINKDRKVADDTRIVAALPTIEHAIREKSRVIIGSHLGRPGGKLNSKLSLEPVGKRLSELLNTEIFFPEDCVGDAVKKIAGDMPHSSVMLLENLRFHKGEEENDPRFAKRLAAVADVYVNEAFSVSHRLHASLSGIVDFVDTACVGLEFKKEVVNLNRLTENPPRPFVAIFGGLSASEKIPIMESLLDKVDAILIGGAISNTFLKALGKEVGKSAVDQMALYSAARFISSASARDIRIAIPEDAVLIKGDLNNYSGSFIMSADTFHKDAITVDIGPKTSEFFASQISSAKTVFWNGPVGVYEREDFIKGTLTVAKAIAYSNAFSIAAGWDTILALKKTDYSDKIKYLSKGGKAALEFIQGKRLHGLEALGNKLK